MQVFNYCVFVVIGLDRYTIASIARMAGKPLRFSVEISEYDKNRTVIQNVILYILSKSV